MRVLTQLKLHYLIFTERKPSRPTQPYHRTQKRCQELSAFVPPTTSDICQTHHLALHIMPVMLLSRPDLRSRLSFIVRHSNRFAEIKLYINIAIVIGKDKGQLLPHKRGTFIVQKDKFWVTKRHILFLSFNISHKILSHKHLNNSPN